MKKKNCRSTFGTILLAGTTGLLCVAPLFLPGQADEEKIYRQLRENMVRNQIEARGVEDPLVLQAMRSVPRHLFVPVQQRRFAYGDYPLPIGDDQTISQPYIVAMMTELLEVQPGARILEIGTGSGYQAAVLAEITGEVYSIEIIPDLARQASQRLEKLGYEHVRVKSGDGYMGWEENAPYDGIIITAATEEIPPPLFDQLKENGRMVLPLGDPKVSQTLAVVTKENGKRKIRRISGVRFVPLTRKK
ncbi:MAG: protein-L-isoaspartate(D-aspartate) O-methyltransferase [Candidatus Aminicenantaceae bacterium]